MPSAIRIDAAKYYDLRPPVYDDVPFYLRQVPRSDARVLELGCGTGRVLLPMAGVSAYNHGVDLSAAMLQLCRAKLDDAGVGPDRAALTCADITEVALGERFELITAPFRVMQNLETDAEVDGLFRVIRAHLALCGTAILNVFRPLLPPERILTEWTREEEILDFDLLTADGRVTRHHTRRRITADPLVCHPTFVHRRYVGETLVEESVMPFVMRCYYPDEFIALIEGHGFRVTGRWGGYAEEAYGEGGELVVAFTCGE